MRSNIVTEAGLPTRIRQWWEGIPFLTSVVTIVCGAIYVLCLLAGYDSFQEVCFLPVAVISRFQVYRIYSSVIFHGSLPHVLFNMLAFVPLGSELERIMGSIRLLCITILLATSNALLNLLIAVLAAHIPFYPYPHFMNECAIGFSGILFSMIVIETSLSGAQHRSVFGLFNVPAQWYAWILLVVFQLLMSNVSLLGHLCGILSGFAYTYGLFNFLVPGPSFYSSIESSTWLSTCVRRPKYIMCTGGNPSGYLPTYSSQNVSSGLLSGNVWRNLSSWMPQRESSAQASITADPLGVLRSWNDSIHFCSWNGITCSRKRQRVTTLNLSYQQLAGTFSPYIGNLSFLRRIHLYQNNFHGSIPTEIGRLFRLQYLNLGSNSFEGGFPTNLSHCVDIRNINMYANHLQGKLPTEFASWHKLDLFALSSNHFIGSIPPSIGNISSIRVLYLDHNNIAGEIPLEVAHLAKLGDLDLSVNNLLGMVPLQLFNISSLYSVSLTQNEVEGTLPEDLGFSLPKLQEFYIGENSFLGPLPPSIANASNLVVFDIAANNITGPIPNNFGRLRNLEWLNLDLIHLESISGLMTWISSILWSIVPF